MEEDSTLLELGYLYTTPETTCGRRKKHDGVLFLLINLKDSLGSIFDICLLLF
jgi:hypothetical protein